VFPIILHLPLGDNTPEDNTPEDNTLRITPLRITPLRITPLRITPLRITPPFVEQVYHIFMKMFSFTNRMDEESAVQPKTYCSN